MKAWPLCCNPALMGLGSAWVSAWLSVCQAFWCDPGLTYMLCVNEAEKNGYNKREKKQHVIL